MRVDGYVRVSRVGGRSGESFISPDVQRDAIARWALAHDAEIVTVHVDLDESGGKADRPGLVAVLERIESGQVQGVVVAKLDRFGRSLVDTLGAVKRIDAAGAKFVSVAEQFDTSTAVGKLVLRMMLSLAEFELDRITESWRIAQERAVARGIHIASASPTGYTRGNDGRLEPNEHAEGVAAAFRLRASGAGWGEVCRALERAGVVGPYGGERWSRKAVKRMLSNRVYLGEARSGEFVNAHAHPPLIDRLTFERVQEKPQEVSRGEGALLSGILRCAGCGFALKADWMRDRDGTRLRLYRCRGEHGMGRCESRASVLGRVIEPPVVEWFLARLGDIALQGSRLTAQRAEAEQALQAAENELAAYRDSQAVAVLGRESWLAGLKVRAQAVEKTRGAYASLPPDTLPTRAEVERVWPTLSVPERRRLLRAGIAVIWLRSGRTLALHERVAVFGIGEWPDGLPGQGLGRNAPRSVIWDALPDGARMALAHDLGEDGGD